MKKIFLTTILVGTLAIPFIALAQQNLGYTPLEPIPGVTTVGGSTITFAQLLKNLFTILITIGALFSVLMFTIGGVRYMLSDVVTSKAAAIKRMQAALWGLLLIMGTWLILHTINPKLLEFNLNPCTGIDCSNPSVASQTSGTAAQSSAASGSGAGTSDQPLNVVVNLVDSYPANSSFAQQIAPENGTIINTSDGTAIKVVYNQNLNNPQAQSTINSFTNDCGAVGGSIQKFGSSASTAYICAR